ncbi:hypothetical protein GVN20_04460 [Runella sp. CRIBMP]|uniref:hypothetical protein n=1 Tax=Runella sp. CRIBMP TaxID=2683261 RepID=UPI0014121C3F|nr:hypothetical protein [Runella sp. CRIBMP]NBB18601.1 hypothetical protein [Runella sp. CRIBMP]
MKKRNSSAIPDTERFADRGVALEDLATHFVVHCPKCQGKAQINPTKEPASKADFRLICPDCFHVESPGHWYGAATAHVSVKCRECYQPLSRSAPWNGIWKKLAMHCTHCGDNCEYEASISYGYFHESRMTDPIFGLPLWLQKDFRGELLWAYNYDHLEMLREYITAKLRERGIDPRNTIRKNSSMVSRLPMFIKKASLREELLKLIATMK